MICKAAKNRFLLSRGARVTLSTAPPASYIAPGSPSSSTLVYVIPHPHCSLPANLGLL